MYNIKNAGQSGQNWINGVNGIQGAPGKFTLLRQAGASVQKQLFRTVKAFKVRLDRPALKALKEITARTVKMERREQQDRQVCFNCVN